MYAVIVFPVESVRHYRILHGKCTSFSHSSWIVSTLYLRPIYKEQCVKNSLIMDFETFQIIIILLHALGALVSIFCCALLFLTWSFLPYWNSLQNCIITNQIICDSAHAMIWLGYSLKYRLNIPPNMHMFNMLNNFICISSVCWTTTAMLLAYLRLVLRFKRKISYEKRIVTFGTLGMAIILFILIKLCSKFDDDNIFYVNNVNLCLLIYSTMSLVLFIKIQMSVKFCDENNISKRHSRRFFSLICVAVLSNFFMISYLVLFNLCHKIDSFQRLFYVMLHVLIAFKVCPLTIVALQNKYTRKQLQRYQKKFCLLLSPI